MLRAGATSWHSGGNGDGGSPRDVAELDVRGRRPRRGSARSGATGRVGAAIQPHRRVGGSRRAHVLVHRHDWLCRLLRRRRGADSQGVGGISRERLDREDRVGRHARSGMGALPLAASRSQDRTRALSRKRQYAICPSSRYVSPPQPWRCWGSSASSVSSNWRRCRAIRSRNALEPKSGCAWIRRWVEPPR